MFQALLSVWSCSLATAIVDEKPAEFGGEWRTTFGVVKLVQDGTKVTGTYGNGGRFSIKGEVNGRAMTFEHQEGQVVGDGKYTLGPTGVSFTGVFQIRGGRRATWDGWRPDPTALEGDPARFGGLWLTDTGLMELRQDGTKVTGRYALRGTSAIEGEVQGRHLPFRFKNFGSGPGWFDLSSDGKSFEGAGGDDRNSGWYAWRGHRADEFAHHAPLIAGRIVAGSTDGLLTYAARAPEGFDIKADRRWPTILILHGSNMNGRDYVATLASAWPEIARDFILLGINGERPSSLDTDDPRFNYTYQNFMGRSTYRGFPGTDRESPALVSEAMAELRKVYPIRSYLVGGHSQGGWLTYSLLMNDPDAIAGAFPISCGLLMQCAPDVFAEGDLQAAQRRVPLAIVHATNDPIQDFSLGEDAFKAFRDARWPALHLFRDEGAGHRFALLPVGRAIRWLEALSGDDPERLLGFAEDAMNRDEPRDAIAAVRRLRTLPVEGPSRGRLETVARRIDDRARPGAARFQTQIEANRDATWVDDFLTYRDAYEFAEAAGPVMAAYEKLRAAQDKPARDLMDEAQAHFNQGRRDRGLAKAREVVDRYYASGSYRSARAILSRPN